MHLTDFARRAMKFFAAAILLAGVAQPVYAADQRPPCDTPQDVVRLSKPLSRVGQRLASGAPITIVAIGSSSTAGAGASTPAGSYPNQLALELKKLFPKHTFNVLNRGVNGEEVPDMVKRFDTAVVLDKPDLVLWQLGTNSLIRDHELEDKGANIRTGLDKLRAIGADIVLIDPQFAPKVIAKPRAEEMVNFIAATAKRENVELFRRFAVMKRWKEVNGIPFEAFVSPDGLHLNDWSYACMAKGLSVAIAEAAQRPVMSAAASPAAVARPAP